MRHADERLRLRIDEGRPPPADPLAQPVREAVGGGVRGEEGREQQRPPPEHREEEPRDDEHEPVDPDSGEVDEEPVEPAGAVLDDPAFEVPVEPDQVGSNCLVWSISC